MVGLGNMGNVAIIKVVGVGGGGSNAVDRMIEVGVRGVEFVALNADAKALAISNAPVRMIIGRKLLVGLGCGGDPALGEKAARESADEIAELLRGADMVFVASGMGGGTGTGGAPVVAEISQGLDALTVAVATKPFGFEGSRKMKLALAGIERLREHVDALILIPNDRLLEVMPDGAPIREAFMVADDMLRQGVQGISDLITRTHMINVDFNDVRAIMANSGSALMGIGYGRGESRAVDAATQAINSKLLDMSIDGAKGVLFCVRGGEDLSLSEVREAAEVITELADPDANIIFGAAVDEALSDAVEITVVATGFDGVVKSGEGRQPKLEGVRRHGGTIVFPLRPFDKGDLEVPRFLRR